MVWVQILSKEEKKIVSSKILFYYCWVNFSDVYIYLIGIVGFVHYFLYCIGGVMVSVLPSSGVDRGFGFRLGQTKDYNFGICCFSTKQAALRSKSNDWLARNQDNVSEWGDMPIRRFLKQHIMSVSMFFSVADWPTGTPGNFP
jgi:hypothetical protein